VPEAVGNRTHFNNAKEVRLLSGCWLCSQAAFVLTECHRSLDNGPVKPLRRCCVCVCVRQMEAVSNAAAPDVSVTRLQLWE